MPISQPRSGYTLPVFACAAAVAALQELRQQQALAFVKIDLIEPATTVEIAIKQTARIETGRALAIALSDPGDNLDLTRDTPVWALVELTPPTNLSPNPSPIRRGVPKAGRGLDEIRIIHRT